MRVVLSADIEVSRVAAFAELAWLERRPELGLLCRAARDQGSRISASTVHSTLGGLSDAGANNVIRWASMLGLCDGSGALTKLGESVADDDEVPIPEQGVYGLWLVRHPMLGARALAVERLASNRDIRFERIESLDVDVDLDTVFRSVVNPRERFIVRSLPSNHDEHGAIRGDTNATCRLRFTLDFDAGRDQWQLAGTIEAPRDNGPDMMRPIQHEPETDGLDLWRTMAFVAPALRAHGAWDEVKRRLTVARATLTDDELRSFRRSFTVAELEVPGKGHYAASFEQVPIGPETPTDAQWWAMARFDRALVETPAYRTGDETRALFAACTKDTPLVDFAVTLPSHDELLTRLREDRASYWSLAAPADLAPSPGAR